MVTNVLSYAEGVDDEVIGWRGDLQGADEAQICVAVFSVVFEVDAEIAPLFDFFF